MTEPSLDRSCEAWPELLVLNLAVPMVQFSASPAAWEEAMFFGGMTSRAGVGERIVNELLRVEASSYRQ